MNSSHHSASAAAGDANDIGSIFAHKMRAGWLPAGVHTWRAADGAALFHRLHFLRPRRLDPQRDLHDSVVTLHFSAGSWRIGEPPLPPGGRPLFMLPALLAAPASRPVYWVRDEVAAAALASLGLLATTACGELHLTDCSSLRGRCVRLWPASGPSAERRRRELAAHLRQRGCLVEELDAAGIAAAQGEGQGESAAEGSIAAAIASLSWHSASRHHAAAGSAVPSFLTVRASEVAAQAVRWLWPGRIAMGKLTLIAGDPDQGKSVLTVDLAARVTRGAPWPVDGAACPRGEVLLVSDEDNAADTIRPRLEAAGADPDSIHILRAVAPQGEGARLLNLQLDLAGLTAFLAAHPQVRLVCLDPLTAYLGESDSHRQAAMRALLQPLGDLAARAGVAIVAVLHHNKAGGRASAIHRVSGSHAFVAIARASFLVTKDPADPDRRLLLPSKNNLGHDTRGYAYRLVSGHNGAPCIAWEPHHVTITADQALSGAVPVEPHPEQSEAVAWLRELLAEGSLPAAQVRQAALHAGLAWRTVQRALKPAGATTRRQGFGREAIYTWSLDRSSTASCTPSPNLGAHGAHAETGISGRESEALNSQSPLPLVGEG